MPATSHAETVAARRRTYAAGNVVANKYRLERLLDEGGMGSVWLATNLDLDASVAIKLLRSDAVEVGAADRMKREARVEARLEHRAIVRVFDCGQTQDGDPFIVMELLDGMCLANALDQNGRMSAVAAVQTVLPIVDGLSAAHDKGIVHRDVKPGNIFLAHEARRLQPKIVDFGIATLGRVTLDPKITLRGAVIGSPSYMSPEQARGLANVDHRADIWGICTVLYEAVTNSPPFRGDDYDAILRSIVEDDVAPLEDPAAKKLWPILERGLHKDPERRLQSMRELGVLLARFLLDQGITEDACGDSLAASWARVDEPNRAASSPSTSSIRSSTPSRVGRAGGRKQSAVRFFLAGSAAFGALALVGWQAAALFADGAPATPRLASAVASERVFPVTPIASETSTIRVNPSVSPAASRRVLAYESLPHEEVGSQRVNVTKARGGNRPSGDAHSGTRGESNRASDEALGLKSPPF